MIAAPPNVLHRGGRGQTVLAPLIGERSFMLCEEDEHKYGRARSCPPFTAKWWRTTSTMVYGDGRARGRVVAARHGRSRFIHAYVH